MFTFDRMSDLRECVISEILCYIQCKMSSVEHDVVVKSVTSFYGEDDIDHAKKLMFEKCKATKIRNKTYKKEKSKLNCQDIINKFNEVGEDCPMFVAADVNNLPLATVDAFDLNAISNNLATVLQMNSEVKAAFTAISLLQTDLKSVLAKLSDADSMNASAADLKKNSCPEHSAEDIAGESPIDYDNDSDSSSESNGSSCDADAETETDNEFPPLPLDNKKLKIPPKKWLTDEGYSIVCNKKTGHQSTDIKTAYSSRVYVNSGRQLRASQKYTLTAAKPQSREHKNNSSGSGFNVFVTRLQEKTKSRDVARYLKCVFGKYFKVEQLKNKHPGYASFKINAETSDMMTAMLDKKNWTDGVFVKKFSSKSMK